jgi:hypothetical protein
VVSSAVVQRMLAWHRQCRAIWHATHCSVLNSLHVMNDSGGACRDIYTPISNLLFHHYGRQKGKSVFADHDNAKWWATVSCCWPPHM